MMDPKEIQRRLETAFPDSKIVVEDTVGDQDHFQVFVASSAFEGKRRIQQHQMVYAALGDAMKADIHALALKTCTPDELPKPQKTELPDLTQDR